MTLAPTNRVGDLVRGLLDKGYATATRQTLGALGQSVNDGLVGQRLAELNAEAARLETLGERLKPDNPVLRALLADLEPQLQRGAARIDASAADLQGLAIDAAGKLTRQLALPGFSDAHLAEIGIRWNVPDPQAVQALVGYVNSPAWAQALANYPQLVLDVVRNQAVSGFVDGLGARAVAQRIADMTQAVPLAQAQTLMRTVQLQSYRDASALNQQANADILSGQIRIATLDDRTCMACIALHGTRLDVGEVVDGHYNCRCTSIAEVIGNPRDVQTGADWFDSLPEERQQRIAGASAFELLSSGKTTLSDFVHTHDDPIFGAMPVTASVKGVLAQLKGSS